MRYFLLGLLTATAACAGDSFDPIDPGDPLIGAWAPVDNQSVALADYYSSWTFGVDGHYTRSSSFSNAEGRWERIDARTIRCDPSCGGTETTAVRTDLTRTPPLMLHDGVVADNGTWSYSISGSCMAHGQSHPYSKSWTITSDGAGTFHEHACPMTTNPEYVSCEGTWTPTRLGFDLPWTKCATGATADSRFVRLDDMIDPVGYVRR